MRACKKISIRFHVKNIEEKFIYEELKNRIQQAFRKRKEVYIVETKIYPDHVLISTFWIIQDTMWSIVGKYKEDRRNVFGSN